MLSFKTVANISQVGHKDFLKTPFKSDKPRKVVIPECFFM